MTELRTFPDLHKRLVARQPTAELKRKAEKARQHKAKLWTQEELDYADRRATALAAWFRSNEDVR